MLRRFWGIGVLGALILTVALVASGAASSDGSHVALASRQLGHLARVAPSWLHGSRAPARRRALATDVSTTPSAGEPTIGIEVSADQTGQAMPLGFLGFSFEYHAMPSYLGRDPAAVNPVFLALVRGLNPEGSPVLRIGGNSTDQTWWPMPRVAPPGGVTFSLTKTWLATVRSMARQLGAKLILGVNLAADDPALAGAEARALVSGIGRRYLDALEVGNEADVYTEFAWYRAPDGRVYFARQPEYDMADYESDFARWSGTFPSGIPEAGPAFAQGGWMTQLGPLIAAEPNLRVVTFHRYPLRGCETNPAASDYPSIPNLLSDTSSSGLAQGVAPFVATAHASGLPFRLDELNSAACTGKLGVSNTFASALWVLDTLFNLASVGVDGVNIHTLPGAPYEPFSFSEHDGRWSADVHPLYYGMLMFAAAFPPGSRLLSLQAPSGPVKAWATTTPSGQLHVVLINKDPVTSVDVQIQLPGASQAPAALVSMSAPSLSATSGVTVAGESFGTATSTGTLPPNSDLPHVSPTQGTYDVTVPAGSAMLLTR